MTGCCFQLPCYRVTVNKNIASRRDRKEGILMKRKYFGILLAAMTIAASANVYAAPSIGQIIPEAPKVVEGNLSNNQQLIVKDVDTGAYKDKKVAEAVTKANDVNTKVTVPEILKDIDVDATKTFKTKNTNQKVIPSMYEPLTPFVDLVIKEGDKITYETDGAIKTTLTIEVAKDVNKKDVLLMQINPITGEPTFIAIEKLNKATGEITATFDSLGPVMLIEKVSVVTKKASPEKYPDKKVADMAEKLKDQKAGFTLPDFIDDLTNTENKKITLDNGQTIDPADYASASSVMDMAIKTTSDSYSYSMSGSFNAQVNCDIDSVDWKSLVTANDEDFDVDAAEGNPSLLTEMEPFTIPDSIVVQADASTGELNYLAEPELSFEYPEKEEEEAEAADDADETADTEENADAEDDLLNWIVKDEVGSDKPNLVIKGEFKGMGPLAIFTKVAK